MKTRRKIIEIDEDRCDGCGNCVIACAEGAIEIVDGKARVIGDQYCDGLGACIGECPQDALKIVERDAEAFDEAAVEAHLEKKAQAEGPGEGETLACGCPSSQIRTFSSADKATCEGANKPASRPTAGRSALGHWPVQIRLVPPEAPFLSNADLVIAADCVPVAYPAFHADFLEGKAVMIGCPKFDDAEFYVDRLTRVFKTSGIRSITVVVMEVPCCSGMTGIIQKALDKSQADIPLKEVVVSPAGEILS